MGSNDFHALTPAFVVLALSIFVAWGNLRNAKSEKAIQSEELSDCSELVTKNDLEASLASLKKDFAILKLMLAILTAGLVALLIKAFAN